ncbi:SH3 domain-containing protein, partial [bacterium]
GETSSTARWLKASPKRFKVLPEQYAEITLRAASIPSSENREAMVRISSDGGDAQIPVEVEEGAVEDRSVMLHAMATVLAAALGGGFFILGLSAASMTDPVPPYMLAGFLMFLVAAVARRDRGLAIAGVAAVIFCSWFLLDFTKDKVGFAGDAAAALLPAIVLLAAGGGILRRMPSAAVAVLAPVLLWLVLQAGADTVRAGAPGVNFLMEPPLSRFERRTVENTRRGAFAAKLTLKKEPSADEEAGPQFFVTITAGKANIRAGAGTGNPIVLSAHGGDRFQLLGDIDDWYEIRLPDNQHGWVYKKLCRVEKEK